ncbi:MAG TPA: hypothetical protein VMI54_00935 [Polyangiaceae bacterium]|nr:hypothetical protein [Polyangiaceae bacterium]
MSGREQLRKHAVAWLAVGAVSVSCGGRSGDPARAEMDGAAGGTASPAAGDAGKPNASAGNSGTGGAQGPGAQGPGAASTAGSAPAAGGNSSHAGGSSSAGAAGFAIGGSSGNGNSVSASGGVGVAGGGVASGAGGPNYGGFGGSAAGGGNGAGRGSAGDSSEAGGASDAEVTQGGIMIAVNRQAADTGLTCKSGSGLVYRIADTLNGHLTTSGTNGVVLACKFIDHGDGTFDFSGNISGVATVESDAISYAGSPSTPPGQATLSVSFASHGSYTEDTPEMTLSYFSSDLGTLELAPGEQPCTLEPASLNSNFVLTDFACPFAVSPDDDTVGCRFDGALEFFYCDTQ